MCDQTEVAYLPDDVVWVKLGNVWWPGTVQDQEKLDSDITAGLKKKPLAVVKFFDEAYEYVRNLDQIYHYNCLRKTDFIRKGLDMSRSKDASSTMKKFPEDIATAEIMTGGDPNIIHDPKFLPEKKFDYSELFNTKKNKGIKRGRGRAPSTPGPSRASTVTTSTTSSSERYSSSSRSRLYHSLPHLLPSSSRGSPLQSPRTATDTRLVQKPLKGGSEYESRIRVQMTQPTDGRDVKTYTCLTCGYATTRINVFILHNKAHIGGYATAAGGLTSPGMGSLPRASSTPKPGSAAANKTAKGGGKRKNDEEPPGGMPKRKTPVANEAKKPKKRGAKSKEERAALMKKKNEAIREKLLEDWDDEDPNEEREEIERLRQSAGSSTDDNSSPVKEVEEFRMPTPKMPASTAAAQKSCFDFEDNDDSIDVNRSLKFGQKLPRVIGDEKPKKQIDDELKLGMLEEGVVEESEGTGEREKPREEENEKAGEIEVEQRKEEEAVPDVAEEPKEKDRVDGKPEGEMANPEGNPAAETGDPDGKLAEETVDLEGKPAENSDDRKVVETLDSEFESLLKETSVPEVPALPEDGSSDRTKPPTPAGDEEEIVEEDDLQNESEVVESEVIVGQGESSLDEPEAVGETPPLGQVSEEAEKIADDKGTTGNADKEGDVFVDVHQQVEIQEDGEKTVEESITPSVDNADAPRCMDIPRIVEQLESESVQVTGQDDAPVLETPKNGASSARQVSAVENPETEVDIAATSDQEVGRAAETPQPNSETAEQPSEPAKADDAAPREADDEPTEILVNKSIVPARADFSTESEGGESPTKCLVPEAEVRTGEGDDVPKEAEISSHEVVKEILVPVAAPEEEAAPTPQRADVKNEESEMAENVLKEIISTNGNGEAGEEPAADMHQMELDINSMPIVIGEDIIGEPDMKQNMLFATPDTLQHRTTAQTITKLRIELRPPGETDPHLQNNQQIITIPGKPKSPVKADSAAAKLKSQQLSNKVKAASNIVPQKGPGGASQLVILKAQSPAGSPSKFTIGKNTGQKVHATAQLAGKVLIFPSSGGSNKIVTMAAPQHKQAAPTTSPGKLQPVAGSRIVAKQQPTNQKLVVGKSVVAAKNLLLGKGRQQVNKTAAVQSVVVTKPPPAQQQASKSVILTAFGKQQQQQQQPKPKKPQGGKQGKLQVQQAGNTLYIQAAGTAAGGGRHQQLKPRQASPNILQRTPRKPIAAAPLTKQQFLTVPAGGVRPGDIILTGDSVPVLAPKREAAAPPLKMVYFTVDEHGNYRQMDDSSLITLETATAVSAADTTALYIDAPAPVTTAPRQQDTDNIFLSIDGSGNVINISHDRGGATGGQDILAKALADTQVLQSDTAAATEPQIYLGRSQQLPTLSHNVLETSLTLNQPIMTPLEVPSAVTATTPGKDESGPSMPLLTDDPEPRGGGGGGGGGVEFLEMAADTRQPAEDTSAFAAAADQSTETGPEECKAESAAVAAAHRFLNDLMIEGHVETSSVLPSNGERDAGDQQSAFTTEQEPPEYCYVEAAAPQEMVAQTEWQVTPEDGTPKVEGFSASAIKRPAVIDAEEDTEAVKRPRNDQRR